MLALFGVSEWARVTDEGSASYHGRIDAFLEIGSADSTDQVQRDVGGWLSQYGSETMAIIVTPDPVIEPRVVDLEPYDLVFVWRAADPYVCRINSISVMEREPESDGQVGGTQIYTLQMTAYPYSVPPL